MRTPDEFMNCIKSHNLDIEIISFDNDLGFDKEGYHLLKDICELDMDMDGKLLSEDVEIFAHTKNIINRGPILQYFHNYINFKKGL